MDIKQASAVPFIVMVEKEIEKPILVKYRGEKRPILYINCNIRNHRASLLVALKRAYKTCLYGLTNV
jgi:hypothetical protein|tara:strand:+ start:559 stop:759 length:201 start_codon:yes stop_codon:yes gene_type:complete